MVLIELSMNCTGDRMREPLDVLFRSITPTLIPLVLLSRVLKVSFMVGMRVGLPEQLVLSLSRHQFIEPESSRMKRTFGRIPWSMAEPPKKISVSSA
ncbi:hypothetical protein D3C78_1551190 [compost metagenome]